MRSLLDSTPGRKLRIRHVQVLWVSIGVECVYGQQPEQRIEILSFHGIGGRIDMSKNGAEFWERLVCLISQRNLEKLAPHFLLINIVGFQPDAIDQTINQ